LAVSLPLAAALAVSAASAQDSGQIPIATFSQGLTSYTQPGLEEIKQRFADKVSLTIFNANFNPQTQVTQCQDAITTKRFKGFLMHAANGAAITPCVRNAIQAGIKVTS